MCPVAGFLAGGGNDGRYIVVYTPEAIGMPSLTFTNGTQTEEEIEIVAQTPDMYPARYFVVKSEVINVFEHFFRYGRLPEDVVWEPDEVAN